MGKPCRCFISCVKLLGIILTSIGFGMLLILIIPSWKFVIAITLFIIGICLICLNK